MLRLSSRAELVSYALASGQNGENRFHHGFLATEFPATTGTFATVCPFCCTAAVPIGWPFRSGAATPFEMKANL